MNIQLSLTIIVAFIFIIFYISQTKFKNKMLCYFIRPNKQKIEKWVPLYAKYIVFDNGKYGIGHYDVDPNCITLQLYNRGFNRFFPTFVPTLEFKWDTPNPLDPTTFQSTWASPEQRNAAWNEHNHIEFSKGVAAQGGEKKGRFPSWFWPIVTIVIVIAVAFIMFQMMNGIIGQVNSVNQEIQKLKMK